MFKDNKNISYDIKEIETGDFYTLGTKEVPELEQKFLDGFNIESIKNERELRDELSNRGLLPSQCSDSEMPSIIVLTTGDILIQQPERYQPEILERLMNWDHGKVILMANVSNIENSESIEKSMRVKQLVMHGENKNLIAISPKGQVYVSGVYFDYERPLQQAKLNNEYPKDDSLEVDDSEKIIKLLRSVQEVLITKGLISITQPEKKAIASSDVQKIMPNKSATLKKQGTRPYSDPNLETLAKSPRSVTSMLPEELKKRINAKAKKYTRKITL